MNRLTTYGLVGLSGVAVVATADSAFGLGGGALLADICRTLLEGEGSGNGGMGAMQMDVKPVPLIALSLGATAAAIAVLTRDQNLKAHGLSEPDDTESAAILSVMLVVARTQGNVRREELLDVFRIVTGHRIDENLVDAARHRFNEMAEENPACLRLEPMDEAICRRRVLSAAMLLGCVARPASYEVCDLIEQVTLDIGATREDVAVAEAALQDWKGDSHLVKGVSLITVLRHRVLALQPA